MPQLYAGIGKGPIPRAASSIKVVISNSKEELSYRLRGLLPYNTFIAFLRSNTCEYVVF